MSNLESTQNNLTTNKVNSKSVTIFTNHQFSYQSSVDKKEIKKQNNFSEKGDYRKQKKQKRGMESSPESQRSKNKIRKDQINRNVRKDRRRSKSRSRDNSRHRQKTYVKKDNNINKQMTYYKTKMCPQFENNVQCPKGSKCSYAHGQHELQDLPNLKKTKLCIAFSQNKCPYNTWDCKYAHGQVQLKRDQNQQKRSNESIMTKYKYESYPPTTNFNYPYLVNNTTVNNPYLISNYPPTYPPVHLNPSSNLYDTRPTLPPTNWSYTIPKVPPQNSFVMNHNTSYEIPYKNWQYNSGVNNQYLTPNTNSNNVNNAYNNGNMYYGVPPHSVSNFFEFFLILFINLFQEKFQSLLKALILFQKCLFHLSFFLQPQSSYYLIQFVNSYGILFKLPIQQILLWQFLHRTDFGSLLFLFTKDILTWILF